MSLSPRCQRLVDEFDAAKARWQVAKGTDQEDDLRTGLGLVQERLFSSGCLKS
jgi:hypothetical protein